VKAMSHWEYNMVCCSAYAKADYSKTNLYVIDNKQKKTLTDVVWSTPLDYIEAMGSDGWTLVCQTPDTTSSSSIFPNQILFSFKRSVEE
jgi:hypothetical protein